MNVPTITYGGSDAVLGPFVQNLLGQLPVGVLLFDHHLMPLAYNHKASDYLTSTGPLDQTLATLSLDTIQPHIWRQQFTTVLSNHKSFTFPCVSCQIDQKTVTLRITLSAFTTTKDMNHPTGMIVFEDISEITAITRDLDRDTKLRTLGRLTANVAHELNGPLDGILRYVNLCIRQLQRKQHDKSLEYLEKARHGLLRMVHIISDLLDFTRSTYITSEKPTLEQMVDDAVHMIQTHMQTTHVQIRKSISYHQPIGQYQNLYQVLCNIIKIAFEAMPQGGRLQIEASLDQQHYLNIIFHDTGEGFSHHIMDQAFDPFISTKEKGTGLGLAVCKDIIEEFKGHIIIQNAAEGGAKISMRMPISEIM